MKKGSKSVNTVDRIEYFALCTFADDPLSMCQVHLIPLYTFRDMLKTNFLLQKCKKENNSVSTVDRVMILALYDSRHGPLSVYEVSLNYLQYF